MSVECLVFLGDPQINKDAPLRLTFAGQPREGERVYFKRRHEGEAAAYHVRQVSYLAEEGLVAAEIHLIVEPVS